MFGSRNRKPVPLEQQSKSDLWLGIAFCSMVGIFVLFLILPLLLLLWRKPAFTFATVLLLGFILFFEWVTIREVWQFVAELYRRRRKIK
jgi:hypothetical protein